MEGLRDCREVLRAWLCGQSLPCSPGVAEATALIEEARTQGLAGLLGPAVVGWPEETLRAALSAQRAGLFGSVQRLDLAARATELMSARGLRALPLKGCALAELIYDSPAERAMGDADILVLDDWARACAALAEAGFVRSAVADHAWAFRDPTSPATLELHHSVTSCGRLFPLDAEGLWQRSSERSGQIRRIPSPADLLVQLSLHAAFQHGLVLSLGQYLDFRRLIERARPAPDAVAEIARAARAERAVAAALFVAQAVVAAPIEAYAHIGGDQLSPRLHRRLAEKARHPLAFVTPAQPSLASVRWQIATGQRVALVVATLGARPHGEGQALWRRGRAAALRISRILRHLLPTRR